MKDKLLFSEFNIKQPVSYSRAKGGVFLNGSGFRAAVAHDARRDTGIDARCVWA